MSINIIVAASENNVIGRNGGLPWHLPEDLKRFKRLTLGHVVIMGNKTWESIPEKYRPLPGRKNIVLAREENYAVPENVKHFSSLDGALDAYKDETVFIIGGGEIYKQMIDRVDKIYLTRVHQQIDGDVFFPEIDLNIWKEVGREDRDGYSFLTYVRNS